MGREFLVERQDILSNYKDAGCEKRGRVSKSLAASRAKKLLSSSRGGAASPSDNKVWRIRERVRSCGILQGRCSASPRVCYSRRPTKAAQNFVGRISEHLQGQLPAQLAWRTQQYLDGFCRVRRFTSSRACSTCTSSTWDADWLELGIGARRNWPEALLG